MRSSKQTSLRPLHSLLEQERTIVLAGRLDELDELNKKKIEILEELEGSPSSFDRKEMAALSQLADNNQRLLDAARKGVTSVRRRFAELLSVTAGAQTYGSDGVRRMLGGGTPKQDKSF